MINWILEQLSIDYYMKKILHVAYLPFGILIYNSLSLYSFVHPTNQFVLPLSRSYRKVLSVSNTYTYF